MSCWKICLIGTALFTFAGCSGSDTLEILIRDRNAIDAEIVDSLIFVVDEDSAKDFWEVVYPRLKVRLEKWNARAEMYAKYADEERKKEQVLVFAIAARAVKEKFNPDEGAFGEAKTLNIRFVIYLINELTTNQQRLSGEARRVSIVIARLMEKGGVPVDPRKEYPNLYKLTDPFKEIYGGKAFFG